MIFKYFKCKICISNKKAEYNHWSKQCKKHFYCFVALCTNYLHFNFLYGFCPICKTQCFGHWYHLFCVYKTKSQQSVRSKLLLSLPKYQQGNEND